MGSYLSLEGTTFQRMPGAGAEQRPRRRLLQPRPTAGWKARCRSPPRACPSAWRAGRCPRARPSPRSPRHRAPAPGDPNAQALAVGADGVVARYTPGQGWQREFLLTSSGAVSSPTLRAVAWPEPNRAYAVGNLGAMWLWRAETGLWEKDPAAPPARLPGQPRRDRLRPEQPGGRLHGRAERGAARIRQDLDAGRSCPNRSKRLAGRREGEAGQKADFTAVAFAGSATASAEFAGSEAMVVAEHDLLVNSGSGWQVQPEVHALLASLPNTPQLNVVAGLPNGGAVLAGRDVVLERNSAGAPWHFSEQPIVDETAVAASAYMEGSTVRAVLSVVPDFQYPPPLVLPPVDPDTPPPLIPPNPLPGDGYLLRETRRRLGGRGARRLRRRQRGQAGQDRPDPRARPRHERRRLGGRRLERRGRRRRARQRRERRQRARRSAKTCRPPGSTATRRAATRRARRERPPRRSPLHARRGDVRRRRARRVRGPVRRARRRGDRARPQPRRRAERDRRPRQRSRTAPARCSTRAGARRRARGRSRPPRPTATRSCSPAAAAWGYSRRSRPATPKAASASAFGAAFAAFAAPFGEGGLPAGISTANIPPPSGRRAPRGAHPLRVRQHRPGRDGARDRDRQLARLAGGERPLPEPRRTAGAVAGADARRRPGARHPRDRRGQPRAQPRTCRRR